MAISFTTKHCQIPTKQYLSLAGLWDAGSLQERAWLLCHGEWVPHDSSSGPSARFPCTAQPLFLLALSDPFKLLPQELSQVIPVPLIIFLGYPEVPTIFSSSLT